MSCGEGEVSPGWRALVERLLDGLAQRGFAVVERAFPEGFPTIRPRASLAAWLRHRCVP